MFATSSRCLRMTSAASNRGASEGQVGGRQNALTKLWVMNTWGILFLAGLCEIGWALMMKSTHGFTKLWPSVGTIGLMIVSFALLSRAMRDLPAGTAYAVWTGIGAVGVAVLGIVFFKEPLTLARVICIGAIAAGIVGLKLVSPPPAGVVSTVPLPPLR